jgi:hypothetical protein
MEEKKKEKKKKEKKRKENLGHGYHSMAIELPEHEPAHERAFLFASG